MGIAPMTLKVKWQFFHINYKIRIKNSVRKEEMEANNTLCARQELHPRHRYLHELQYFTFFQIIQKVRLLPEVSRKNTTTTKNEKQGFGRVGHFEFVFLLNQLLHFL